MNKKVILTLAVVTALGLGALGSKYAMAQSMTDGNPMSSLVAKIATKFNLNQSDVQAVFDEDHQAQEAQREAQYESRLSQLVTDGKITKAQKQLIIQKRAELEAQRQANRDSMQNLSDDERKTKMEEERTALKTWADQNGIDMQYLMMEHGGPHGGFGGPHGEKPTNAPTNDTTTQ